MSDISFVLVDRIVNDYGYEIPFQVEKFGNSNIVFTIGVIDPSVIKNIVESWYSKNAGTKSLI